MVLHPFSERMKLGRYFEYPTRVELTSRPTNYFKDYELAFVKFTEISNAQGVIVPQLGFVKDGVSLPITSTPIDPLVDLEKQVSVPANGITSFLVRFSDSHVREFIFLSGSTSMVIATTRYKDGGNLATKIESNQEIIGYYGYLDDDNSLKGIGLFVYNH